MISPAGVRVRERFFAPFCSLYSVFKVQLGEALILSMGLGFAADPLYLVWSVPIILIFYR